MNETPECIAQPAIAHLMIRIRLIYSHLHIKGSTLLFLSACVPAWPRLPMGRMDAQLLAAELRAVLVHEMAFPTTVARLSGEECSWKVV